MKVAIAGGSGLVGHHLMEMLIKSEIVESIFYFGRSESVLTSPKIKHMDINEMAKMETPGADVAFCCLGTTIKKAGSQEAFEKVDLGMVLDFAKLNSNVSGFHVISAMGADKDSSVFYNRTKGKMEGALKELNLKSCSIYRPSILTGDRSEFRLGERIGIVVMKLFSPLMLGSLKKYRPIKAETVAKAMFMQGRINPVGFHVIESDEIKQIARN